jgi:hypothetical protein
MLDGRQSEEISGELVLFAEEADRFNGSLWAIRLLFVQVENARAICR